jgi:chloramphenicol-sensitive protein RarD
VAFAALGVGVQFYALGSLPWVSLSLGFSFALYGAARKRIEIDSIGGLYVESILLLPLAGAYLLLVAVQGNSAFLQGSLASDGYLVLSGAITAIPLLLYVSAAKLLPLSTLGIIFFLTPTMQFISGLLLYQEPVNQTQWYGFFLIWFGLIIFVMSQIKARK